MLCIYCVYFLNVFVGNFYSTVLYIIIFCELLNNNSMETYVSIRKYLVIKHV